MLILMEIPEIAAEIVLYQVNGDARSLATLKAEIARYAPLPLTMPAVLANFVMDEMKKPDPFTIKKRKGPDPDPDKMWRDRNIGWLVAFYQGQGLKLADNSSTTKGAFTHVAEQLDLEYGQVEEFRKRDYSHSKKLKSAWHAILSPLPAADRKEILSWMDDDARKTITGVS